MKDYKFFVFINDIPYRLDKDKVGNIFKDMGIGNVFFKPENFPTLADKYLPGSQKDVDFFNTAQKEMVLLGNGGITTEPKAPINAPILITHNIRFADFNGLQNYKPVCKKLSNSLLAIPFTSVTPIHPDLLVIPDLFQHSRIHHGNSYGFIFKGTEAQRVKMGGSIKGKLRVSTEHTHYDLRRQGARHFRMPTIWFAMASVGKRPKGERNQRNVLGINQSQWTSTDPTKLAGWAIYNKPQLEYQILKEKMKDIDSYIFLNHKGGLAGNYTLPNLHWRYLEDATTDWIPVGCETSWLLETDTGKGTTCRIQWLKGDGTIDYDIEQGGHGVDPNKILNIPSSAVAGRIFWRNNDTPEEPRSLSIKPVPVELDPFYGSWMDFDININVEVMLEPDLEYQFYFQMFDGQRTSYDDKGLILESSDINFELNMRKYLQETVDRHVEL